MRIAEPSRAVRPQKTGKPKLGRAAQRLAKRKVDYGLDDRLIPIDAVIQLAGIGKTMIYRKMREGTFPKSCNPGGASTRWSEKEVREWRDRVLAERYQTPTPGSVAAQ